MATTQGTSSSPGSSQHSNIPDPDKIDGTNNEYYHQHNDSITSSTMPQHLENSQNPNHASYWGYGPLARIQTNGERLPAFGGDFQPGLYKPPTRNIANPAPLGLAGFALTTFLLSLINCKTRGITETDIVIGPAFAYGGLIQLLAGMWEFPNGNVFGATALSSYGGFWISLGIILTPGGFDIAAAYGGANKDFYTAFGFYIMGWFIFTFILWLMTLKSTVAFSSLFFTVWMTFLMLGIAYLDATPVNATTANPNEKLVNAGGGFGLAAGFIAWWNMLAGIADNSNSFFLVPVLHFPWSEKGRAARKASLDDEAAKRV